jgi:hypothetical protein
MEEVNDIKAILEQISEYQRLLDAKNIFEINKKLVEFGQRFVDIASKIDCQDINIH